MVSQCWPYSCGLSLMLEVIYGKNKSHDSDCVFRTQSPATVHHPEFQCGQHTYSPARGGNDLHLY